ncbi:hypothetical protein GQR58_000487 [Nymphon striatum]|nr:hypothetical protein GQR58_000487 [Nymphon striatum]
MMAVRSPISTVLATRGIRPPNTSRFSRTYCWAFTATTAFAIILVPQGPEQTVENIHLYYPQPEVDADLRARNTQLWKEVFKEDIFVVEGMQRGRHATGFDGGDQKSLVGLYTEAADHAQTLEASCFYLTHAYVFALELGDNRAKQLHARLKKHGREA